MYELLMNQINNAEMDNLVPFIDNAASQACDLLREILDSGNIAQRMQSLFELCALADCGFKYAISRNNACAFSGFIWQTPAMRSNFHRFGNVIFLDVMKRKHNSVDWPYIGLVICGW